MAPRAPRAMLLVGVLLLSVFAAGCNARDWYNQQGTLNVNLIVEGPKNSSVNDFRSIKIALYGVSVRQILFVDTKEFSYGDSPLIVDLVPLGLDGEKVQIATTKVNMRPVESVTLHFDVVEAIDAQGKVVPVCRLSDASVTFPCFFMPENNAFRYEDRPFSPPRGGTATFDFPLSVKFSRQGQASEYFLLIDANLAQITTKR